jgi:MscS family membrane protein
MDFLDHIFLDNTVRAWLVVVGIIIVALMLKRYVSRYFAAVFFRVINRIWKSVNREKFFILVVDPFKWFLVILVAIFAIDKLNFPSAFNYTIYGHSTADILSRIGTGVIIVSFIWLILRLMDFIAGVLEERNSVTSELRDNQLVVFFRDFLKVIIGIVGVLLIIKACFNQPLGNLLTSLSIVGAALALGAKESLENLIASFIIFFDKPFFTGDTVKVNNIIGRVEKIGLRSTRILTGDKTLVTMPNKQMVDSIVDNWSMRTQRRAELRLDLSVKTPVDKIEWLNEQIKQLLVARQEQIMSYSVFLRDIGRTGITLVAEYFTGPIDMGEFDTLKQAINVSVKKLLEEQDIEFASDANTIVINNDVKEN